MNATEHGGAGHRETSTSQAGLFARRNHGGFIADPLLHRDAFDDKGSGSPERAART